MSSHSSSYNKASLVSVVVPEYNDGQNINRCVKSVRDQNYRNWELIIVDDGSLDGSAEKVRDLVEQDDRIRAVYHQRNLGRSEARNSGIKIAQGEFIAFLDADDVWLPNKLQKQVAFFDRFSDQNLGLVATEWFFKSRKNEKRRHHSISCFQDSLRQLLHSVTILTSGVMVRRSVFSEVGLFDPDLVTGQDWDMWLRIAAKYQVKVMHEPLLEYSAVAADGIGRSSSDKSALQMIETRRRVLDKHRHLFAGDRRLVSEEIRKEGVIFLRRSMKGLACRRFFFGMAARFFQLQVPGNAVDLSFWQERPFRILSGHAFSEGRPSKRAYSKDWTIVT